MHPALFEYSSARVRGLGPELRAFLVRRFSLEDGTPHRQIRDTRAVWQELGASGSLPERHRVTASDCTADVKGYWFGVWGAGDYVEGPMLLELWRPMLARLAAIESAVAVHAAQLSDGLTEVEGRLQSLKYEAAFDSPGAWFGDSRLCRVQTRRVGSV